MGNQFTYGRHSYSIEEDNFTRFGQALLTIGPMIFQTVLESFISPKDFNSTVTEKSSPQFWKMLNPQEKSWLAEATSYGYTHFDVNFCYKLWKFVCLERDDYFSDTSAKGKSSRIAEGVEIERIMRLHNVIYYNVENQSIPTRQFKESWTMLTDICTQMQLIYPNARDFPGELASLESRHFTDEERKTIYGRLNEMKDQGKKLTSLQFPGKDQRNVSHAGIFSKLFETKKIFDDDAFTDDYFDDRELQHAKNLGVRIQRILILIERHLHTLADILQMFSKDKRIYRVPWRRFSYLDVDEDSDMDTESSEKGDQIPQHRISEIEAKAEPRVSATARTTQYISCILEDVNDDLFLLSTEVDAYVFEHQAQTSFHSYRQVLLDYLNDTEDFAVQIKRSRIVDHRNIRNVKDEIEYHIQQMEEYVNVLSQEVKKMHFGNKMSTERKDEKYARKSYGYREYSSEKRIFLYERCLSFKGDWNSVYSSRIREHITLIYDNVKQTDVSEGYPDKHTDFPIEPKGEVLLPDERSRKIEHQSIHKGQDKMFQTKTRLAEREMEVNIQRHKSYLWKGLLRRWPRHHELQHHNRILQLFYHTKVIQNNLTMLRRIQRLIANDTKNEILLQQSSNFITDEKKPISYSASPKALDFLPSIRLANCTLNSIFTLCMESVDDFSFRDHEFLQILEEYWEKRMYENKKRFYDERLECLTEKIKYYIHQIENNQKLLLEHTDWMRKYGYGIRFNIPTLTGYVKQLRVDLEEILIQLNYFVEVIEQHERVSLVLEKMRDDIDGGGDKPTKKHFRIMPYMTERTERQGRRQALQMVLEGMKERFSTTQFLIHKKYGDLEKHVIIGYDTSIPRNKIIRTEEEKVEVFRKNPYHISDEAAFINNLHLMKRRSERDALKLEIMQECIKQHAQTLWRKHSNLTIITGDTIRAVNKTPVPETCIVLYCLSKGYIPINEEPFPQQLFCRLGKIRTDVREGYFCLGPTHLKGDLDAYNDPICMGSNIGGSMRNASGSLGLFINLPNNERGFITCCHVLFDCIKPNHFSYESTDTTQHVIQPGNSSFCGRQDTICGEIKQAKFCPNVSPVSIDAAIVKVKSRMPTTGHFVIKNPTQAIDLGFTKNALPVFDTGKVRRQIDRADLEKPLLKSGTSSGLTRSLFRLSGTQVRINDDGVWLGIQGLRPIVMEGQYEVESGSIHNPFFITGDSGSAVFMKDPDGQLACIGIAIGKTSFETTVVTPIGAVLDGLGLKDSDVTKFP